MDDYVDRIAIPQVREILGNYGADTPAVLWWDTPKNINPARALRIEKAVQAMKPGIIQNNRLCNTKTRGTKDLSGRYRDARRGHPGSGLPRTGLGDLHDIQ